MYFNRTFVAIVSLILCFVAFFATSGESVSAARRITPTPTPRPTLTPTPTRTLTPTPTPTRMPTTPSPTVTPTPVQGTPTSTPTQSLPQPLMIFDDSMATGWTDASYNTTSTTTSSLVYSGTRALAATISADGGLDFQSVNGQTDANYTTFHFVLQASQANQRYEVYSDSIYGQPLSAPVSLGSYGGQPVNTGWRVYDIPVTDLGAGNSMIKDLVIHDMTSSNQPVLYVDQVALTAGSFPTQTPTPTPTLSPTQTPTPIPSVSPTPTNSPTPTFTPTPTPSLTPTPTPNPTQTGTYMALGDSFAFGFHLAQYQQEEANNSYTPSSFNDGFDMDFFRNLQGVFPSIQEINYSCPGETSSSFVSGGCSFHSQTQPLHTDYPVSEPQLQAALNYIQSHPNVSVITIEIGVNDAINLSNICQAQTNPQQCYSDNTPGVLSTVQKNYDTILNALQQSAPKANIIIVKFPNPVYYDGSDSLVNGLNQIQDNEASSRGLRIADGYSIFTANNVCTLTNFCATPSDFHPNAQGYSAMAQQIWNASGYGQ